MKTFVKHLIFLACLLILARTDAGANEPTSKSAALRCETGPITKTFGGTRWLVYSCEDSASIAVVTARGNPASPAYFFLKPEAGQYHVFGEGNGDKRANDAALDELSHLSPSAVADLLAELAATGAGNPAADHSGN